MKTIFLFVMSGICGLFAQTGDVVPELGAFDKALPALLKKYAIPGAAVSISKDGRLVYSRGFGVADIETGEPVQPDSLFRVASVSKPITAVGVLRLVEQGAISLDTKVLRYLGRTAALDPRWYDITVRHLLQHSGGLDLDFWGFDPSFPDRETLESLGANLPPSRADILDFVLANLTLAYAPGTKATYSNVGYMLLTEVVEKASGQSYEAYMREKVLTPLGIVRMRIAGSLLTDRQPGEVRYWAKDDMGAPIFPGLPELVPTPYGYFNIRIFESGGGWLATAPDLVRFLTAFDEGSGFPLLKQETVRTMLERPGYVPTTANSWYGLGWQVDAGPNGVRISHDGAFEGTVAWMFRGVKGVSLAVAANHLPDEAVLEQFFQEFEQTLNDTAINNPTWPAGNIFGTYFPGENPRISDAGVVNAASLRPGRVAADSVVTLFGINLDGASVRVNGILVETLWSSPGQLQLRVPAFLHGQTGFQVERHGKFSNTPTVRVAAEAPGIFTVSKNGYGQAAALNGNGTANSIEHPAAQGSIVAVYVTGVIDPEVTVAGKRARVVFRGPAPGLPPGVTQLNVKLPIAIPSGVQPVLVQSRQGTSQSGVTIAIQ